VGTNQSLVEAQTTRDTCISVMVMHSCRSLAAVALLVTFGVVQVSASARNQAKSPSIIYWSIRQVRVPL